MDNPCHVTIFKPMEFDTDIAIVGGGLNGPALALALAQLGLRVTVFDALAAPQLRDATFDGRAYALALTSARLMQGIGIWDDVQSHTQPMLEIKVTDGRVGEGPSPLMMQFDHAEIEEGPMGYMVEDRYLRIALLRKAEADPRITLRNEVRVIRQNTDQSHISLTCDSSETVTARLLIGADGRGSGTAERAGIKRIGWGYGQTALVCALEHTEPHNGIAHQFFMPPGPLAILPLPANRSAIVWSEAEDTARHINAMPDSAYLDVLGPRFGDFLGDINLVGARYTYPLSLSLAHTMVAPRLALVGDAAHGVHPIAGQGLNAGLKDIAALTDVLSEALQRGEDIGSDAVLARYQTWRRFDNTTLALATDSFNRLFSNDNGLMRIARDLGMAAINAMPGVRRSFIREAAGLTGELPTLMQSKSA